MKDCLSLILVFFYTITFNGCSPKNKIEIQDLDLNIPTEWSFPIHNNVESTTDWWTHFNNPYLDTFLNDVKDYSPDFKTLLQNQKISLNNAKILGANILPSIIFSQRIQEKASSAGFDWDKIDDVWLKINEEINELKIAQKKKDLYNIHEEIGDLLFSVINLSRHLGVSAENALRKSNKKFIRRFKLLELRVSDLNRTMDECSSEELNKLWDDIKSN